MVMHMREILGTLPKKGRFGFISFWPKHGMFLGITVGPLMLLLVFPRHHWSNKAAESFQSTPVCPHDTNLWSLEPIGPGEMVSTGTGLVREAARSV